MLKTICFSFCTAAFGGAAGSGAPAGDVFGSAMMRKKVGEQVERVVGTKAIDDGRRESGL
jgi:hypothetical protein